MSTRLGVSVFCVLFNRKGFFWRLFQAGLWFLTALLAPASAAAAGRADTLIVFAGFGYLDEQVQPQLARLLYDQDPDYAHAGDFLMKDADLNASSAVTRRAATKWTRHDVVADADGLNDVLAKKLGRPATLADRNALFQHFEKVYGVVLIGGLEYEAHNVAAYDSRLRRPYVHHYVISSVTAGLVDLTTGRLALSATRLGAAEVNGVETTDLAAGERAQMYYRAYAGASRDALGDLARLMRREGPPRDNRAAVRETYAVTDTWVASDSEAVFSLFERQRLTRREGDLCTASTVCPPGAADCEKFTALLAHGMTADMSRAGALTEPPLQWSQWRAGGAFNATIRLSISDLRNAPVNLENLALPAEPAAASVKVIPILTTAAAVRGASDDGASEVLGWNVGLKYQSFRTRPENCGEKLAASDPLKLAGAVGHQGLDVLPGRGGVNEGLNRLMIMLAVQNGFDSGVFEGAGKGSGL